MVRRFIGQVILFVFLVGCSCHPCIKNEGPGREADINGERIGPTLDSCLHRMPERIYPAPIIVAPSVVPTGSRIFLKLGYTVLRTNDKKAAPITQVISVMGQGINTELLRRKVEGAPGTHISYLRITLPKDGDPGQYTVVSRFIAGDSETSARGSFRVFQPRSRHPGENGNQQARN